MSKLNNFFGSGGSYEPRILKNEQDIAALANPNLLINGDFSLWQRGDSFTGYEYGCDRWIGANTTVTKTQWKEQGTVMTANKAAAASGLIAQAVELQLTDAASTVKPFVSNGQVTVSVTVQTTNRVRPHIIYRTSAAGTSSPVTNTVFEWQGSGTAGVQTLSWKFSIDHLPTDPMRCLVLTWQAESASVDVVFINSKMELGPTATPFVPDSLQVNLAKCQRYYFQTRNYGLSYNAGTESVTLHCANSNWQKSMGTIFPVTMRISPRVIFWSYSGANTAFNFNTGSVGYAPVTVPASGHFSHYRPNIGLAGHSVGVDILADAEL